MGQYKEVPQIFGARISVAPEGEHAFVASQSREVTESIATKLPEVVQSCRAMQGAVK